MSMSKNIIIVGGGISGLTALHYLRKKYQQRPDVDIQLLELESEPGGTIRTIQRNNHFYETGPNGFLDNKPSTLALAFDLGLTDQMIAASPATKVRFICVENVLYQLPANPFQFFNFKPLRWADKLRVLQEIFIPRGNNSLETVYEFGTRRLGENFARYFLDPMVSGIFGGNAQDLNLQYAFPRIYEIEQKYSSLFIGMAAIAFQKRRQSRKNSLTTGQPTGQLWSFQKGMGQLTEKLATTHRDAIKTGMSVQQIVSQNHGYAVKTIDQTYFADQVIVAVPACAAAEMLAGLNSNLAAHLRKISYASIVVIGLTYSREQFKNLPQGFGYLRPTHEGSEVLGVLFSSNIYHARCPKGEMLFQIMLGGDCHADTVRKSNEELFDLAKQELSTILGARGEPKDQFLLRWGQAIPQYRRLYPEIYQSIQNEVKKHPHLHLLANYLDGVSLNDCTSNAQRLAERITV
jgi:oxygen-dependent protoporphyrinogen oxidase